MVGLLTARHTVPVATTHKKEENIISLQTCLIIGDFSKVLTVIQVQI